VLGGSCQSVFSLRGLANATPRPGDGQKTHVVERHLVAGKKPHVAAPVLGRLFPYRLRMSRVAATNRPAPKYSTELPRPARLAHYLGPRQHESFASPLPSTSRRALSRRPGARGSKRLARALPHQGPRVPRRPHRGRRPLTIALCDSVPLCVGTAASVNGPPTTRARSRGFNTWWQMPDPVGTRP